MFGHCKKSPKCQELRFGICTSATAQREVNKMRVTQVEHKAYPPKDPNSCPIKEATREDTLWAGTNTSDFLFSFGTGKKCNSASIC